MSQTRTSTAHREASAAGEATLLRRQCACGQHTPGGGECEECRGKKGTLQRAAASSASAGTAPPVVHEVLSSPGRPLDAATRAFMEPRFGHDFSGVRVHADARAAESARSVGALAYTVGQDVVFGEDRFRPGSAEGRTLLAHELAHTVQQSGAIPGAAPSGLEISDPASAEERQAEVAAAAVSRGEPVGGLHAGSFQIARQPAQEKLPSAKIPEPATARVMKEYIRKIGRPEINELIKDRHRWWEDPQPFPILTAEVGGVPHVWEWKVELFKPESVTGKGNFETSGPVDSTRKAAPGRPDTVVHTITTRVPEGTGPNTAAQSMFHELIHVRILIDRELPSEQRSKTFQRYNLLLEISQTPLLIPLREKVRRRIEAVIFLYAMLMKDASLKNLGGWAEFSERRLEFLVNEKFAGQEAKKIWEQPQPAAEARWRTASNADIASRYAGTIVDQVEGIIANRVPKGAKAVMEAKRLPTPGDSSRTGDESLGNAKSDLETAIKSFFDTIDRELGVLEDIRKNPQHASQPPGVTIPPPEQRFGDRTPPVGLPGSGP